MFIFIPFLENTKTVVLQRQARAAKDKFTFEDTYNSKFAYKYVTVTWISGMAHT